MSISNSEYKVREIFAQTPHTHTHTHTVSERERSERAWITSTNSFIRCRRVDYPTSTMIVNLLTILNCSTSLFSLSTTLFDFCCMPYFFAMLLSHNLSVVSPCNLSLCSVLVVYYGSRWTQLDGNSVLFCVLYSFHSLSPLCVSSSWLVVLKIFTVSKPLKTYNYRKRCLTCTSIAGDGHYSIQQYFISYAVLNTTAQLHQGRMLWVKENKNTTKQACDCEKKRWPKIKEGRRRGE